MTQAVAALLGALVGAGGGVAAGVFTGIAVLRSSQLAARSPLASKLHALVLAVTELQLAKEGRGKGDNSEEVEFGNIWNDLSTSQRILCPSERIELLLSLVYFLAKDAKGTLEQTVGAAGQALDKAARMVAAHSKHLFSRRAIREETRIIDDWLASEESQILTKDVRDRLASISTGEGLSGGKIAASKRMAKTTTGSLALRIFASFCEAAGFVLASYGVVRQSFTVIDVRAQFDPRGFDPSGFVTQGATGLQGVLVSIGNLLGGARQICEMTSRGAPSSGARRR